MNNNKIKIQFKKDHFLKVPNRPSHGSIASVTHPIHLLNYFTDSPPCGDHLITYPPRQLSIYYWIKKYITYIPISIPNFYSLHTNFLCEHFLWDSRDENKLSLFVTPGNKSDGVEKWSTCSRTTFWINSLVTTLNGNPSLTKKFFNMTHHLIYIVYITYVREIIDGGVSGVPIVQCKSRQLCKCTASYGYI